MSKPTVLFVCTGNAARSVMAAVMLRSVTDRFQVESAGTHSIPGLPMSTRTRSALATHDLVDNDHRSRQVDDEMLAGADLVVIFEPMHLRYLRKEHPAAAERTASLHRLARDLVPGPLSTLTDRVGALDLGAHGFEEWEEVIDPAGGDVAVFENSADEIAGLIGDLVPKMIGEVRAGS